MIDVSHLFFKYQEDQEDYTLKDVSFHVKPGEWVSIVGHNGSGKSTTARLLDGLLLAESGKITIAGKELTEDNIWTIRQDIGMVFQNPDNQFVGATVEDDVAFGLENKGISHSEMATRVEEALKLVDMASFRRREPARLSGGQKQRVAIAGAIAVRPKIIIFDESTSMLDPEGRQELLSTIQKIRQEFQLTILSITHDLDEVVMSDRVIVMRSGEIESISTPQELFERGEEVIQLGLDLPFTTRLQEALKTIGYPSKGYMTETELENKLWEFLSNK
ncbi:energy-coupling factor ABC transporter ATP-binding protein [Streptococcus hyovaginalis]|uniref:energy-coupling factor ABC transporter ATP-binding protein n=1 Tax=Streptococcus hyovaginalis TaxID=149015 RepID=UPI001478F5AC|nr:energy-coupling factor ABC transporter ATP-binding protein [Streptococcus hyovaginalis]MDY3025166.1 energy-coupling factor ABC transporter ATP-binding protein [Streptococcus hyovaginalis]MDY4510599.1 energy-coupling factor ABC transporter ATP-binding protein [Streptococcus hyovaginalis]